MPELTAVVVHRAQPDHCIATVRALTVQAPGLRTIVVDNGSGDAILERLRAALPDVELIDTGVNLGFGPGANVGLRAWLDSRVGEWAFLCPHDAQPQPGCLDALLDAVGRRARPGLVCAEFGSDEKPVVDRYFGGMTMPAVRGEGWESAGFPHGTLMALSRACLSDIGLFDEDYFAYCEEADLAIRARRAGWEVGMVWGAVVKNPHQSTAAPAVDYLMLRNSLALVRRHFGRYRATVRFVLAATSATSQWLRPTRREPWFSARARALALRDYAMGRMGPPPARITA